MKKTKKLWRDWEKMNNNKKILVDSINFVEFNKKGQISFVKGMLKAKDMKRGN